MSNELLHAARDAWIREPSLALGRALFERVPPDLRPRWAAEVLHCAAAWFAPTHDVDTRLIHRVLSCARDPNLWREGHRVFDQVRDRTLTYDDLGRTSSPPERQRREAELLLLAELVAKVTYNATNPHDEFDEDSGWYVAGHLRDLLGPTVQPDFEDAAWRALTTIPLGSAPDRAGAPTLR